MQTPLITTLNHLQNQSNSLVQWRRETIVTQNKNGLHLFAHFYFPKYHPKQPPDLRAFICHQTQPQKTDLPLSPAGILLPLSMLNQACNILSACAFLILDLGDVLTHADLFQTYLKQKAFAQQIVLFVSDTELLSITDLSRLSFDFIYLPPQNATVVLPQKALFNIQNAADYHLLKHQKNVRLGGPFVDAFLAQKRFQKCPFKKECTSAACTHIGTHPNDFLKCADPLFLSQTLTEFSHEIR